MDLQWRKCGKNMSQKVDFIFIGKIDTTDRYRLLEQTHQSFCAHTPILNINSLTWIDDFSKIPFHFVHGNIVRHDKQMGVGASKNDGVSKVETRGDLVYFSDSDVYFTENWLEKMLDTWEKHKEKIKILAGGCHPFLQNNDKIDNVGIKDAVSGWSWLTDWWTLDSFGKLADNAVGSGQSEDWDFSQRLRKAGYLVGAIEPAVVSHTGIISTEGKPCVGADLFERLPNVLYL